MILKKINSLITLVSFFAFSMFSILNIYSMDIYEEQNIKTVSIASIHELNQYIAKSLPKNCFEVYKLLNMPVISTTDLKTFGHIILEITLLRRIIHQNYYAMRPYATGQENRKFEILIKKIEDVYTIIKEAESTNNIESLQVYVNKIEEAGLTFDKSLNTGTDLYLAKNLKDSACLMLKLFTEDKIDAVSILLEAKKMLLEEASTMDSSYNIDFEAKLNQFKDHNDKQKVKIESLTYFLNLLYRAEKIYSTTIKECVTNRDNYNDSADQNSSTLGTFSGANSSCTTSSLSNISANSNEASHQRLYSQTEVAYLFDDLENVQSKLKYYNEILEKLRLKDREDLGILIKDAPEKQDLRSQSAVNDTSECAIRDSTSYGDSEMEILTAMLNTELQLYDSSERVASILSKIDLLNRSSEIN